MLKSINWFNVGPQNPLRPPILDGNPDFIKPARAFVGVPTCFSLRVFEKSYKEASNRVLSTSVSVAFKPIPFSDDYQPKGNFILEELWKHLLELLRADDSLFVPNSIQRYTIYIQSILLSLTYPGLPRTCTHHFIATLVELRWLISLRRKM